ncbi:MAG: 6-deoxyerythronolide-B synthase, partial [Crocosphaera sp.]
MKLFNCIGISPIGLANSAIAVDVAKADGVGILDLEFMREENLEKVIHNFEQLIQKTNQQHKIGLRLRANQIDGCQGILERLVERQHWLIICDWNPDSMADVLTNLSTNQFRTLLLEVVDEQQVLGLGDMGVDGLVAKGNESGGWVSEDSTFILVQKLLKSQLRPVYAQGGIGIHTAAACRAVGAAGVVLDDQLWLMPNSHLPEKIKNQFKNLNGQEAIAVGERIGKSCRVLLRPGYQGVSALQQLADDIEVAQG